MYLEICLQNVSHFVKASMCLLILAWWRHMASVNWVIIGSDKGAQPLPQPMLTYCQLDPQENIDISSHENASENVVYKMATILFRPQCVNSLWPGDVIWRRGSQSTLVQVYDLLPDSTEPAITWTNDDCLSQITSCNLIWELFSQEHLKMLSANYWPFYSGLNVFTQKRYNYQRVPSILHEHRNFNIHIHYNMKIAFVPNHIMWK